MRKRALTEDEQRMIEVCCTLPTLAALHSLISLKTGVLC